MRKIAVFTGTRAEYGVLYWIIKALHTAPDVQLQLLVGGMHLSPEFGYTVKQIEDDDFPIVERMEFLLSSDSPVGISKSMGLALINAAGVMDRQKPDLLLLLGDRFETMAVAQAAMVACVPIAHIHGGETTEGAIDEAARHSITKMSHLHFAATEKYRNRIIQLGENPERVFNFGAPGIDNILKLDLLKREELDSAINFQLGQHYFLITYHPVTLEAGGTVDSLKNLLTVLDSYPDHKLVITYPNADSGGRKLIEVLEAYQHKQLERVLLIQSLGQIRYLSVMKHCDAVIGNSSSGLIEAPTFNIPSVNIGNRQKGRIAGETVINCNDSVASIKESINKSVSDFFIQYCQELVNPYGKGNASERIVEQLLNYSLDGILKKQFYDLSHDIEEIS